MLKVEHVTKTYGNLKAVDDLSFEVKEGEIFGLLGVNGAGKTTTFRAILGLIDKDSGTITLNGKEIDYDVTDSIGFLTEERSLLTKLTVLEQAKFYGVLTGMKEQEIEEKLDFWLKRFQISDYKHRKIKELSKGNQQKVQFITAVMHEPKVIILDEPFSGLDPLNIELFKEAILEFKKKGSMIIFSSHRMEHVELFCEKLVILLKGKTVLSGGLKEIKRKYAKKNIRICGDVEKKALEKIKGVDQVSKEGSEYLVRINDIGTVENVFAYVKTCQNITKFAVEEPSLNEIFIETVGEAYDK